MSPACSGAALPPALCWGSRCPLAPCPSTGSPTQARHLRRSRPRRTRPGTRPCKQGGGVSACPRHWPRGVGVKPASWGSSRGARGGCPGSRGQGRGWDSWQGGQGCGDGRGHGQGQGVSRGWRMLGHDCCWESQVARAMPDTSAAGVPGEGVSIQPTHTAGMTVPALGHRRLPAGGSPRGAAARGVHSPKASQGSCSSFPQHKSLARQG